jgi:hypothetical protein
MDTFINISEKSLIDRYSSCLREGIESKDMGRYKSLDSGLVLFVEPVFHKVEVYFAHYPLITILYEEDNITWQDVTIHNCPYNATDYHSLIRTLYQQEQEREGGVNA